MPPHCDTRDGPVVSAARVALETGNVNFALIWVPESAESELKDVFEKTLRVRKIGPEAQALADEWFFENVVRLHRAGEGAPFSGLKPAGLDWGPVVPRAEKAIETMMRLTRLASFCALSKTICSNGLNAPFQQRTMA